MPESAPAKRARARKIVALLGKAYPDATIALRFETPLELVVATILAAQCTDERVNQVTPDLFRKYRSAADFARANPAALEAEVRSAGFFRAKTRAIIGMARALVERHGGEVPRTIETLTALPGIGRKTAAIVLLFCFGRPALPVDTHVYRVATRLGMLPARTPLLRAHDLLEEVLGDDEVYPFHVELIRHGRDTCRAPRPICGLCPLTDACAYFAAAQGGRLPIAPPPKGPREGPERYHDELIHGWAPPEARPA
jgi:endonuclease-3